MNSLLNRRIFLSFDVFTVVVIGIAALVTFAIAYYAADAPPPVRRSGSGVSTVRFFLIQTDTAYVGALRLGQRDLDANQSDVTGEATAAPTLASIAQICTALVDAPAAVRAARNFQADLDEPLLAAYEYACQQAAQPTPLVPDQPISMRHNFADMIQRFDAALHAVGRSAPGPYQRLPNFVAPNP